MTSSDDSDGLDDNVHEGDEYEILFRHTEQGFKYRKDVLTKLRRSNTGTSRTGRDQARRESPKDGFGGSRKEMLDLEFQIEELKRTYSEAKSNYLLRHNELDSLKAHLEKLGNEICDFDTTTAGGPERSTEFQNEKNREKFAKNQASPHISRIFTRTNSIREQNIRRMHDEISKRLEDELSSLDKELSFIESDLKAKEARLESILLSSKTITSRDRAGAAELLTSLDREISDGKRLRDLDSMQAPEMARARSRRSDSFASSADQQV